MRTAIIGIGCAALLAACGQSSTAPPRMGEGHPPSAQYFVLFFALEEATDAGPEAAAVLDRVGISAARPGRWRFLVVGHADEREAAAGRAGRLSRQRAQSAAAALVRRGYARGRQVTIGWAGVTQQRIETPYGVAEAQNRRAEITVTPALD